MIGQDNRSTSKDKIDKFENLLTEIQEGKVKKKNYAI
jgi:hypothetical protein